MLYIFWTFVWTFIEHYTAFAENCLNINKHYTTFFDYVVNICNLAIHILPTFKSYVAVCQTFVITNHLQSFAKHSPNDFTKCLANH